MARKETFECDVCGTRIPAQAYGSGRYISIPCMAKASPGFNPRFYEWVVRVEVCIPGLGAGAPAWSFPDLCKKCFKKAATAAGVTIRGQETDH